MQAAKSIEYIKQQMMVNQLKAPQGADQKDSKQELKADGEKKDKKEDQ